jgi:molybdenum cofactor cytidylyltransferase
MNSRTAPALRIVILAAGFSARLGQPKALARIHGTSLLERTIRMLAPWAAAKIIVVVPPRAGCYRVGRSAQAIDFIANRGRSHGLSSSVLRGLDRARHSAAVLLVPVDLVELDRRDIARLIGRWRGARRRVVARRVGVAAGTPLILPHWLIARTRGLTGDKGLRDLVRGFPVDCVSLVDMPSAGADVDTPRDLERARRRLRSCRPQSPHEARS